MPRRKPRLLYRDRWTGLREEAPIQGLPPGALYSCQNVELFGGYPRPRRGYSRYSSSSHFQPGNPQIGAWSIRGGPDQLFDDLLFCGPETGLTYGSVWRRVFVQAGVVDWARVFADTLNNSPGWHFDISRDRRIVYQAGDRLFFLGSGDVVYVYHRETMAADGNEAIECTGTAEGGGSDYILLDNIVGSTSEDNTYTFSLVEIELTGGTGSGQRRWAKVYDHTGHGSGERYLQVSVNWTTAPDNTTTYRCYRIYARKAGLEAPSASSFSATVGAGGSLPAGRTFSYRISYYDSHTGLESNGSDEVTGTTSAGNQTITVAFTSDSAMPTTVYGNVGHASSFTGLFANRIRYYRRDESSTDPEWRFIAERNIDVGEDAASSDLVDDGTITPQTSPCPTTHGVPPRGDYGCFHQGRAFISDHLSSTIFYSEAEDPATGFAAEYFAGDIAQFNLQNVDLITWLKSYAGRLIIWQQNQVFAADTGSLPDSPIVNLLEGVPGTLYGYTIAEAEPNKAFSGGLFYANDIGVYLFGGQSAEFISETITARTWCQVDTQYLGQATGVWDSNYRRYILFTRPNGGSYHYQAVVFETQTPGWVTWYTSGVAASSIRSAVMALDENRNPTLYLGMEDGRVGYWSRPESESTTDSGSAITWELITGSFDFGAPANRKHVYEIVPLFGVTSGTPTVTVACLANGSGSALCSRSETLGTVFDAPLYVGADLIHCAMKISGTAAGALTLVGFDITYEPRGQR